MKIHLSLLVVKNYLNLKTIPIFGIPFDESLSLKPIQSKLNSNLNVKLNLYFRFLINKSVPLLLKKYVLISFILSLVIYYAPLFGSNKSRCSKAQKNY